MIIYFTASYESDICDNLIELWERETARKKTKNQLKYFMIKRNGT